jgi:uncharacterized protein DUF1566/putative metal-binding protein
MRMSSFFRLGVIFLFIANQAFASDDVLIFEASYTRGANPPIVEVADFQGYSGPGIMLVTNVGVEDSTYEIVSSITVALNDQEIFSGQNFDPSFSVLQEAIDLFDGSNSLSVVVKGKPNGRIDIEIIQDFDMLDRDGDGFTPDSGDCNDDDININPDAPEICADAVDNNCDGVVDENCVISGDRLPDTGQTTSYTDTFGEDSDYHINPLSYIDNGDGTVTDNNTGLMWQQEDDNTLYNWYQASGTAGDTEVDVCGELELAYYYDWRLPTEKELQLIVNYGTFNPAIDQAFFTGPIAWNYWSSITLANPSYPSYAWYVNFNNGIVNDAEKSGIYYVRCVRGGQ